jgi:hypothetical protein
VIDRIVFRRGRLHGFECIAPHKTALVVIDMQNVFCAKGAALLRCVPTSQGWAASYWGANLDRLRQVKSQYDPANVFRHAQSVPLS